MDAVLGLVARLPEGARYALWTTGDRPTKVVDHTDDRQAAGDALRRVAPQGGNYMLDAFGEAAADLKKLSREGDRTVVVAVTGTGPELSYRDKYRAAEEAEKSAELFLSVQVDSGDADFDMRSNLSYVMDRLARATGGRYEVVLSAMGTDSALRKLSAHLRSGYRLAYATAARSQEAQARPERRPPGDRGPSSPAPRRGRPPPASPERPRPRSDEHEEAPLLVALALAAATAPTPVGAQARPQAPIFGTGIEIINLSLSVTDAQNNFVTNLGQRDFAVFEDGIRQELSLFTHENLPISLVLMIDTSASMEEKLGTAQDGAIQFTKTLRPQDLAQVVQFNDRATTLQPFTNDLARSRRRSGRRRPRARPRSTTRSTSPSRTSRRTRRRRSCGGGRSCCCRTARTPPRS